MFASLVCRQVWRTCLLSILVLFQGLNFGFSDDLMFRNKAQHAANGYSLGKCCNAVVGHQVSALWVSLSGSMDCVVSLAKGITIPCETRLAINPDKLTESKFKP